jgi:hypothetical protein
MKNYTRINAELIQYTINGLHDLNGANTYVSDLHHEIFNTDYFLIGYYNCEKWLNENVGIFQAMDIIKEYEENNFGVITTDLTSSENVLNMYVYIKGEEILNELETIQKNWDKRIDDELLKEILNELNEML